jgi:hypothetical protein
MGFGRNGDLDPMPNVSEHLGQELLGQRRRRGCGELPTSRFQVVAYLSTPAFTVRPTDPRVDKCEWAAAAGLAECALRKFLGDWG